MKPTREQVLAEPAGPQMDAWVAEFCFGARVVWMDPTGFNFPENHGPCLPDAAPDQFGEAPYVAGYSTNIAHTLAAARALIEAKRIKGFRLGRTYFTLEDAVSSWAEAFSGVEPGLCHVARTCDSEAHALCRALLLAVMA